VTARAFTRGGRLPQPSIYDQGGTARWSPDGRPLAYDSRTAEHSQIWIVEVNGGAARPWTRGGLRRTPRLAGRSTAADRLHSSRWPAAADGRSSRPTIRGAPLRPRLRPRRLDGAAERGLLRRRRGARPLEARPWRGRRQLLPTSEPL